MLLQIFQEYTGDGRGIVILLTGCRKPERSGSLVEAATLYSFSLSFLGPVGVPHVRVEFDE